MTPVISFLLLFMSLQAPAENSAGVISEVGAHEKLFTFEKNENPQNIMVLYTKLNPDCSFKKDADRPVFDEYWLMNRTKYKPVHSMIKRSVQDRLQVQVPSGNKQGWTQFTVHLNDLKELKNDLPDVNLNIESHHAGTDCRVESWITLGPSSKNQRIRLTRIYTESRKILWPPFRQLLSVKLEGQTKSGLKVQAIFMAK